MGSARVPLFRASAVAPSYLVMRVGKARIAWPFCTSETFPRINRYGIVTGLRD